MGNRVRNLLAMAAIFATGAGMAQTAAHKDRDPQRAGATIDWNAPMPSEAQMRRRVMTNLKRSEAEQERYVCKATNGSEETDKRGNVKHRTLRGYDMFFVNGQEIDKTTSKGGKPLSARQQKKEVERVQEQIAKDSDAKYVAKRESDDEKRYDMALRMLRFTNGRRTSVGGRSTLVYNLVGDPAAHPKGMEETFLRNMSGTIQVDEATGELVDLNARLDHDVKLGGGLLANLHKGLWIHVRQRRYPDGVWLTDLAEGNGDARAALFFHPYFRFRQTIDDCALTNVTTRTGESPAVR